MLSQIIIRPVMNPFYFVKTIRWKIVFNIPSVTGIKNQVFVLTPPQVLFGQAQVNMPLHSFFLHFLIFFFVFIGPYKILRIGLLKLSTPKQKISRRNLVSKRFANLADTKRNLRMKRINNIFKIQIYSLTCFSGQKNRLGTFFGKITVV